MDFMGRPRATPWGAACASVRVAFVGADSLVSFIASGSCAAVARRTPYTPATTTGSWNGSVVSQTGAAPRVSSARTPNRVTLERSIRSCRAVEYIVAASTTQPRGERGRAWVPVEGLGSTNEDCCALECGRDGVFVGREPNGHPDFRRGRCSACANSMCIGRENIVHARGTVLNVEESFILRPPVPP